MEAVLMPELVSAQENPARLGRVREIFDGGT